MAETEYPVTVLVDRGGRNEEVRIGTAVRSSDGGFVLRLSELHIGGAPAQATSGAPAWGGGSERRGGYAAAPASAPAFDGGGGGGGMVFPPYGRSKGQPIA